MKKNIYRILKKNSCPLLEIKPRSIWIIIAQALHRWLPRGKGFFPRMIGKYLLENNQIISVRNGKKLVVYPSSLDEYMYVLNNGGVSDKSISSMIQKLLKDGGVFFDVGSNIGSISIDIANNQNNDLKIIAFEPNRFLATSLAQSFDINLIDNYKVIECGLADYEGESILYVEPHSSLSSLIPRSRKATMQKITVTTIDKLIMDKIIPPPDLIKIDVEGCELKVLKGGKKTLIEYKPVLIFEMDINLKRFDIKKTSILKFINSLGGYYCYFLSDNEQLSEINLLTVSEEQCPDGNYIATSFVLKSTDSSTKCNKDQPVEVAEDVWHHGRFNRQVEVAQCTNTSAEKSDTRSKAL